MATLHLTNVPPEVLTRLEDIAALERSTVEEVAVRELDQLSRRAGNGRLLDALPSTRVQTRTLLDHLDEARAGL